MDGNPRPILVAGGGIAGLTAALALARRGHAVRLFERAEAFSEVGAGLQLSPNAARHLIALGVDARLDPHLGKPDALVVRAGATGAVLVEMPLGDVAERRWGAPFWVAHRADLQAALVEAARDEPSVEIVMGASVEDVAETPGEVTVRIVTGAGEATVTGAALVAADGLWSRIRLKLAGDVPPHYSGRAAFRATIPVDGVPGALRRNATGLWLGPGAHLVHYPLRGGALVNLVAIVSDTRADTGWEARATREEVIARYDGWHDLARALIALPAVWTRWALFDRAPDAVWPGERIVPVGDAAHPMVPFLAQGASMAIEDAALLARGLGDPGRDVPAAIGRFKAARAPRVARVQREARANGDIFHWSGPLAFARDSAIRLLGAEGMARRYDWLYGGGR